ncbi:MAG: hypothetical protein MI920_01080 [Kiloniellales bacterium]|nr:hypothetical protein [Kiloniellales bacterium]
MVKLADAKLTDGLVAAGLLVLGLVLMVTPLALWVAWSPMVLVIILATSVVAGALYCLLVRFERPVAPTSREPADRGRREDLPEQIVDELQSFHPFIYHNRLSRERKFDGAMRRLKRYLYGTPD